MKVTASAWLMVWMMSGNGCIMGPPGKPIVLSGRVESIRISTDDHLEWVRRAPRPTRKFKHLFIIKENRQRTALDYLYVNDVVWVKQSFPASKHYPRRDGYWLQAQGDRQWFKDWGNGQPEELCWDNPYRWLYAQDDDGQFIGEPSSPVLLQVKAPLPQKNKSSKCSNTS